MSEYQYYEFRAVDRPLTDEGAEPLLRLELLQRMQAGLTRSVAKPPASRRTVAQLLSAAEEIREARERAEMKRQTAARVKVLDALAARESNAWDHVDQLLATRRPSAHQEGVKLLVDLRDVARRRGTEAEFIRKLSVLRERNARRAGLLSRLDAEGLRAL